MSGGGQSTQTTSTKNVNEPPAFIKPYLQAGIGDLTNLYNSNKTAPEYYPGQTVAPFSSTTESALSALEQRGANGSPLVSNAQGQLNDTISGNYLDPTTNPQFQAALTASNQPYIDQFMGTVLPGITSSFEGSGRTGSPAHQAAVDRAVTGLNRTISDSNTKAGADYFNTERGRQVAATTAAPTLANQDYVDINQQGLAGQARDNQSQALIDADVAKYNYDQNAQWDYINRYLASLNGGYPGGTSTGTGTTTGSRPNDTFGQIFGAGTSLAGLGLMAFSDERLKENIEPIGKSDNGTRLYSYNYIDDPTPRVGPMAQEVAETHPDAVAMDPSGYLKVDYRKALGLF